MIRADVYGAKKITLVFDKEPCDLAILPHPRAPLFEGDFDEAGLRDRLQKFIDGASVEKGILEIIKQLGLVNLWFFEKFILGAFGPWDKLNPRLHLDMCNWCQSDYVLGVGARSALAIGRGHFKSTVRTTGLMAWLIVRNPDIKICVVSSVFSFASRFLRDVRTVFEQNGLVRLFWPSLMYNGETVWNDTVFFTPGRSKAGSDGTVTARGLGGASASQHFDVIMIDDPVTIEDLDKDYGGNANMDAKKQWLRAAILPLLVSPEDSLIMYTFTFYAPDDFYMTDIVPSVYHLAGYLEEDFIQVRAGGKYSAYWRPTPQDGEAIFPEVIGLATLQEMMQTNPWMYQTQYKNWPVHMETSDFRDKDILDAIVYWDDVGEPYLVVYDGGDGLPSKYLLKRCDVLLVVDWAASKKSKDARKSKTAIELWALTDSGVFVCFDGYVGKASVPEAFNRIFEFMRKYGNFVRAAVVEVNAMQLGVSQLFKKEMVSRGMYFSVIEDYVRGDKEARIKVNFGSQLMLGKVACTDVLRNKFIEEKNVFGSVKGMFDTMDAAEKACRLLIKPDNVVDRASMELGDYGAYGGHEDADELEIEEWDRMVRDSKKVSLGQRFISGPAEAVRKFISGRA